jgi:hypothetical protein
MSGDGREGGIHHVDEFFNIKARGDQDLATWSTLLPLAGVFHIVIIKEPKWPSILH